MSRRLAALCANFWVLFDMVGAALRRSEPPFVLAGLYMTADADRRFYLVFFAPLKLLAWTPPIKRLTRLSKMGPPLSWLGPSLGLGVGSLGLGGEGLGAWAAPPPQACEPIAMMQSQACEAAAPTLGLAETVPAIAPITPEKADPTALLGTPAPSAMVVPRRPDLPRPAERLADAPVEAVDATDAVPTDDVHTDDAVDIDPRILEESPVLRRWLEEIPDVATDIKYDPAWRTRLRVGYALFPSNNQTSGFQVGIQDVFVGRTPLTFSADYYQNSRGDRAGYGIDAQYYILPLGWYGNVAPVLGYRHVETDFYTVSGINVGFRIVLIPSRTSAVDLSFSQTWVAPGTANEVGLTTFSVGYALTSQLRISTDIQTQNTDSRQDSRVGVLLEWML